jgi:hypothetical protein
MPTTKLGTIARRAAKGRQIEEVPAEVAVTDEESVEPTIEEDETENIE